MEREPQEPERLGDEADAEQQDPESYAASDPPEDEAREEGKEHDL